MQIKTKIVNCHTADSKPAKQEVNGTVILPTLVFPGKLFCRQRLSIDGETETAFNKLNLVTKSQKQNANC